MERIDLGGALGLRTMDIWIEKQRPQNVVCLESELPASNSWAKKLGSTHVLLVVSQRSASKWGKTIKLQQYAPWYAQAAWGGTPDQLKDAKDVVLNLCKMKVAVKERTKK